MRAKKSLGQHFLKSERALRTIIESGEIISGETVLEIGPGQGVLTERLLEAGAKVIAVEKDDFLFEQLKEKLAGKFKLIHGDILDFDPSTLPSSYKVIANIPYNITGAILKKFLSAEHQPQCMVLLVQKEVAERIVTRDAKESILSISVKAYGVPRYVEKVLAGSFVPAPKVDSAIIKIEWISKDFFKKIAYVDTECQQVEERFFKMLRAGFQSKRKKLSSNLSKIYPKEVVLRTWKELELDENLRAEDLPLEKWRKLAK